MHVTPFLFARLNAQNAKSFQNEFFIDQTVCLSSEMVRNVAHILTRRTICPLGTRTAVESVTQPRPDDTDTLCIRCEPGTYNAGSGALACLNVTACSNAMYWDATRIDW